MEFRQAYKSHRTNEHIEEFCRIMMTKGYPGFIIDARSLAARQEKEMPLEEMRNELKRHVEERAAHGKPIGPFELKSLAFVPPSKATHSLPWVHCEFVVDYLHEGFRAKLVDITRGVNEVNYRNAFTGRMSAIASNKDIPHASALINEDLNIKHPQVRFVGYDHKKIEGHIDDFCRLLGGKGYNITRFEGALNDEPLRSVLYDQVARAQFNERIIAPFSVSTRIDEPLARRVTPFASPVYAEFKVIYSPQEGFKPRNLSVGPRSSLDDPTPARFTRKLFTNADIPVKTLALSMTRHRKQGIKQ